MYLFNGDVSVRLNFLNGASKNALEKKCLNPCAKTEFVHLIGTNMYCEHAVNKSNDVSL